MESYELRLTGHPLPGHDRAAAAKGLAQVMRLPESQAAGLLAGRETLIKRGLTGAQLPSYLKALEQAGVGVRIEPPLPASAPAPAPAPAPAELTLAPVSAPEAQEVECPACGARQPKRNLCRGCGADMPRLRAARELANDGPAARANPFQAPSARVADISSGENNSGEGRGIVLPPGVKGWSWGAFLLNWIWALFNRTWIGLLCLVPYVGFLMSIYLGIKGRELAWCNKRWDSVEHFNRVQRRWSVWGLVLVVGVAGIGILAAIALPAYVGYARAARGG